MNAVKWTVLAALAVTVLVGAAILAPLAMAQGPSPDGFPSFDIGQNFDSMFSRGSGMGQMRQANRMTTDGFAANSSLTGRGQGSGPGFIGSNSDGQCDNFIDEDGDGMCDLSNTGRGQGTGSGFEDADGDGVCDHAVIGGQQGTMRHGGQGRHSGQSRLMGNQPAVQPTN
jgi:hypothetical protein